MCWSGVPWQVGPNLSYGFAAASGGNYRCGRCYQLQFSGSGHNGQKNSLNGKMMIVQVINNGGVAQNQFDLLIPGGGVGAFERLREPVGSSSRLGRRYGGFLAGCNGNTNCVRAKCQQIFANKPELLAAATGSWVGSAAQTTQHGGKQITCPSMVTQIGTPVALLPAGPADRSDQRKLAAKSRGGREASSWPGAGRSGRR